MEQSTSDGSTQTTDPLPERDDDPIPTDRLQELDALFETQERAESSGFVEDFSEFPPRRAPLNHGPHEYGSPFDRYHALRLWRG